MKKLIFILLTIFVLTGFANAQHSPFKPLPKPVISHKFMLGAATTTTPLTMTAWRFTAPMGGILYTKGNSQVVTAVGFGWNSLAYDTSNGGAWVTKFAINGIILGGGNFAPNPSNPASIMSVGISLTLFKGHINAGPVYNFPTGSNPTGFTQNLGVFVAASIPLL